MPSSTKAASFKSTIYHTRLEENRNSESFAAESEDGRWARCRRPFIASGGELTLEMLNLSYNSVSKIYEAPSAKCRLEKRG